MECTIHFQELVNQALSGNKEALAEIDVEFEALVKNGSQEEIDVVMKMLHDFLWESAQDGFDQGIKAA